LKVAVIGAGVAGTASAWAASRAGAEVTVIAARAGASELYPGVVDLEPWERCTNAALDASLREFVTALGLWVVEKERCLVVTTAGVVRPARGRDAALLDLVPLAGKHVAVADVLRDDWDGELVTRALSASQFARETGTRFSLVSLELGKKNERSISAWDFAHGFDGDARLDELAKMLDEKRGEHDGWLFGPWLGTLRTRIGKLRERVSVAVGESTSPPGGAAGARFEGARDELIEKLAKTTRIRAHVSSVTPNGGGWNIVTDGDELHADRVVIAAGGVVAGGISLDPRGTRFQLSFEAPLTLELDGLAVDAASTPYGLDFAARGLTSLERIGVREENGLYACGDVLAGRPRTVLEAARSGIRAVERALAPS
jgi:glycerol-3-phosphate dehydrogenase subunit B